MNGLGGVIREMSVVTIKVTDLNQANESKSNEGPALIKSKKGKEGQRKVWGLGSLWHAREQRWCFCCLKKRENERTREEELARLKAQGSSLKIIGP